jgi:hypothetical protein
VAERNPVNLVAFVGKFQNFPLRSWTKDRIIFPCAAGQKTEFELLLLANSKIFRCVADKIQSI